MLGFSKTNNKLTDEELVTKLAAGDHKAFSELYHRYSERLMYYFYRMLGNSTEKAEDFLQDIFMKIIDKAGTFDPSRKFSTWIFSIAHNMCKNEYRSMGVRKNSNIDEFHESVFQFESNPPEIQEVDTEQFLTDLFNELETFDEIHKTVFLLHYREDFSLKEIGQILDISEGTVKSRLFYARKRLSERLAKYNPQNVNS